MDRNPRAPYVTLSGLPVRLELEWPFRPSQSGADWFSLHGRVWLDDDSGLHADVAVNLTQVIKEALPSLASEHAESAVVNATRKDLDNQQLELVKSGKRQPVPVSSRHYDSRNKKLIFAAANDEQIYLFLRRKVYWLHARVAEEARLADPCDMEYLNATKERMIAAARRLESEGLATLAKGFAAATEKLLALAPDFAHEKEAALGALLAKHDYEHG